MRTIPPAAGNHLIAGWQPRRPGQAEVTLQGALAAHVFAERLHRLSVHRHQPSRHHGEQRFGVRRQGFHAVFEGLLLGRQDVQGEVVGGVGRQLFVPGIHQLAA
ncbi:hypothetical protein D9M70_559100 [compost metagenome]